ncbi:hypothetical protein ACO2IY_19030 [Leptospira interrogans]
MTYLLACAEPELPGGIVVLIDDLFRVEPWVFHSDKLFLESWQCSCKKYS